MYLKSWFITLTIARLSEPDLLEKVATDGNWTEVKVAELIKKLLMILRELEAMQILHLDIKVNMFTEVFLFLMFMFVLINRFVKHAFVYNCNSYT